jgi:hypothetical protein
MGLFPWDDVFYHISDRSANLRLKYNEYQHTRDNIITAGAKHRNRLDQARSLLTTNFSLLIIQKIAKLDQSEYENFIDKHDEAQPEGASGYSAMPWIQGTVELLGIADAGTFVCLSFRAMLAARAGAVAIEEGTAIEMVNIAGRVGMLVEGIAQEAAEAGAEVIAEAIAEAGAQVGAEAGAEVGAEAVAEAIAEGVGVSSAGLLAATGIGIFVAVGLDTILGKINGAKEDKELSKQEQRLADALSALLGFLKKLQEDISSLETVIINQQREFLKNIKILDQIQSAGFDYDITPSLDNIPVFEQTSQQAVHLYGFLSIIRRDWTNFKENADELGLSPTWENFMMGELARKPSSMSVKVARKLLDYAKNNIKP